MSYLMRIYLCITTLAILASCSVKSQDAVVRQGDIIYTYKEGRVQCLSQKEPYGTIAVLVQSLEENTVITDVTLGYTDDVYAVQIMMAVKKPDPRLAGRIDIQEVTMPIEPIDVSEITLEGKPIIAHDRVIVLIPHDAQLGFTQLIEGI